MVDTVKVLYIDMYNENNNIVSVTSVIISNTQSIIMDCISDKL